MSDRQSVTEESKIHKQWYREADEVRSLDDWTCFAKRLMEDFEHDYGTICHAIAAGAVAACKAMNRHPNGGITGFQASFVMWGFIQNWMHWKDEPLRILQFREMLYPQYADKFEKTISRSTMEYLQREASKFIAERDGHPKVRAHMERIAAGEPPFGYRVADE